MAASPYLLGSGLRSPLRMDPNTGDFERIDDEDNVVQCVRDLILTSVGERMDYALGTGAGDLLFENAAVAADLLEPAVIRSIRVYEPRVDRVRVQIETIRSQAGSGSSMSGLRVTVGFVIVASSRRRNLIVPFTVPRES